MTQKPQVFSRAKQRTQDKKERYVREQAKKERENEHEGDSTTLLLVVVQVSPPTCKIHVFYNP